MTTTVYDVDGKVVTTDSRWSINLDGLGLVNHVLFVDNTEFEKLANRQTVCVIFAGDLELISEWKAWLNQEDLGVDIPRTEISQDRTVSLTLIHKKNNQVLFDCGLKYPLLDEHSKRMLALFAGSGGINACHCWVENRCARTCIGTAATADPYTGGEIKFLNFVSDDNNLGSYCFDPKVVMEAILDRGKVMNVLQAGQIVDLKDFDKDGVIKSAVLNGALHATAPVGGDSQFKWTEERKSKLRSVLAEIREEEQSL
ncbi:hypothetical protein [Marinomonas sp.]